MNYINDMNIESSGVNTTINNNNNNNNNNSNNQTDSNL